MTMTPRFNYTAIFSDECKHWLATRVWIGKVANEDEPIKPVSQDMRMIDVYS